MTHPARILFVEDEVTIGETLSERLREDYAEVVWVETFAAAKAALAEKPFDLALLDVNLPDGSGFDVAAIIREQRPTTAVVFLTAMGAADDRVRGLELGAEDYIVKPFNLQELLLRLKNVLKRSGGITEVAGSVTRIGIADVDFSRFTASVAGDTRTLTHKEWLLLRLLDEKRGEVVSRDEILDRVWAEGDFPSQRTVDNFIVRIRRLIDGEGADRSCITSIRSVGYRLEE